MRRHLLPTRLASFRRGISLIEVILVLPII